MTLRACNLIELSLNCFFHCFENFEVLEIRGKIYVHFEVHCQTLMFVVTCQHKYCGFDSSQF